MDTELLSRCKDLDDARDGTASRADAKLKRMWGAAYAIRSRYVPLMTDDEVEALTELAFLSTIPAYRHITLMTYTTSLMNLTPVYKTYFAHLVNLARRLDKHGDDELATGEDWIAWMGSLGPRLFLTNTTDVVIARTGVATPL